MPQTGQVTVPAPEPTEDDPPTVGSKRRKQPSVSEDRRVEPKVNKRGETLQAYPPDAPRRSERIRNARGEQGFTFQVNYQGVKEIPDIRELQIRVCRQRA